MTAALPVSGVQHSIAAHGYVASVASVGASLRSLTYDGRDLVVPFAADELRPALRGAALAPWPNRLANGRYLFGQEEHRLPLNEPETGNAAHGLVAWLHFGAVSEAPDRLTLAGRIEPQPGYPWRVRIDVLFELGPHGLRQRITATNESTVDAPIGLGAHPYLVAGNWHAGAISGWTLQSSAHEVLLVSADRLLPIASADVGEHDDGMLDFRIPRRIGDTELNHAFSGMQSENEDPLVVTLTGSDGHGVELSCAADVPWVQLYSADQQPAGARRHALAVEPMTCPPDSFNSGRDLRILSPAASTSLEWRLRAL